MPSRRVVRPCIESSFGVAKAAPVLNTDCFYMRLSEAQGFEADLAPQVDPIMYGGGRMTEADESADVYVAQGSIETVLYPGVQTALLLGWALTPINAARTAPWETVDPSGLMPPGDLASLCFYQAFQNPDGSYTREKWLGCKSTDGSLGFSEGEQGRKLIFKSNFVGVKVATNSVESPPPAAPDAVEFPFPAEADYPTGPWLFSHLGNGAGAVKIGAARPQLAGLTFTWKNVMKPRTYQSRFHQVIRFLGRQTTLEAMLRYSPTPDDMAAYQSRAFLDSEFVLDNGTNTLKVDFHGKGRLTGHERQYPNDEEFGRKVTLSGRWDPAAATDLTLTATTN